MDDIEIFLATSTEHGGTKKPLSPSTRTLYAYHLKALSAWMEEQSIKPRSLTPAQLLKYLDTREWSDSSKNLTVCAVRAYWKWKYTKHPVCAVRIRRSEPGPQRTLSKKEIEQLISVFNTEEPKGLRDLALVMLMVDTGLRASEICSLTMDHLDMGERLLFVRVKGDRWEPAAFFEYATSCLENWLVIRKDIAKKDTKTVFCSVGGNTPGHPLTRDGLRAIMRDLGEAAGLETSISPHALRRSFTCLAFKAGAPSRTVQLGGRWKDLSLVERYSKAMQVQAMHPYSPANYVMGIVATLKSSER
jgi:integrase/recombinase XerD